jgi:uncharacterized membrane protein
MLVAVGCFGVDLLLRAGPAAPPGGLATVTLLLDIVGTGILTVGGWYGGDLVFRHGVGASPDRAPSPGQAQPADRVSVERQAR